MYTYTYIYIYIFTYIYIYIYRLPDASAAQALVAMLTGGQ